MTSPSVIGHISAKGLTFLAAMTAGLLTVGCASAGGSWSVRQSTSDVNHIRPLPGAWDRVEALRRGSRLLISLKNGEQVDRAFADLRPDVLLLTDPAGAESSLPRGDVQRIVAVEWRDGLTNGVSIGGRYWLGRRARHPDGTGSRRWLRAAIRKMGCAVASLGRGGRVGSDYRQRSEARRTRVSGADRRPNEVEKLTKAGKAVAESVTQSAGAREFAFPFAWIPSSEGRLAIRSSLTFHASEGSYRS
jgi:hypothetical protein